VTGTRVPVLLLAAVGLLAECGDLGCGGGWAASDTASATDAVHVEAQALALCANASMLYRHGQSVPDAGVSCLPP
jgi:hypothetical protein